MYPKSQKKVLNMFFLAGSPFSCVVDEIAGNFVTAFGTGLVGGMSGQDQTFTITARKGTLSKSIIKYFIYYIYIIRIIRIMSN